MHNGKGTGLNLLRASCAITVLAIAAGYAAPAAAQVDEIVVTAQKRAENLQDVPISVGTLNAEQVATIFSTGDTILSLSTRVPGLYAESSNGRIAPRFYIRGLGNADFDLGASQPVSVIMDDVVLENVTLKSAPIFDVDQVEVLRGPQGTLFGRNTTAGIIKFDTVKPSDTFDARASVTFGTYNTNTAEVAIGGPLIPGVLSARLSLLNQGRDNYINNGFTGQKDALGGYEEKAARLQLLYTPTSNFKALLNVHTRDLDGTAAVFRANILSPGSNQLNSNYIKNEVFFDAGANNPQAYNGAGTSLKMDYDFGPATLTSISAYETTSGYSRGDIDGGNPSGPGFIPFQSESQDSIKGLKQYTQELRLASNSHGPFKWQAGAYYFDSKVPITTNTFFSPLSTVVHYNTSWAVFGQGSYDLTDRFSVEAGVRYTDDKKHMDVLNGSFPTARISDSKVTWDVSGKYKFTDDVSGYVRVAKGFRGPSIEGRDVAFGTGPSTAKSETVLSEEVGLKSELADHRVRLNGAIFHYKIDDMQLTAIGGAGNNTILINAKNGEAYGVELDSEFAVTERLLLTAGFSYNHTKIEDPGLAVAPCALCTVTNPLTLAGNALINGNPFPNAPEITADITARYGIPLFGGELYTLADYAYQGKTNLFLYESKEFNTDGNFELGLKVGYNHAIETGGSYELAVFARNLTDEANLKGAIDFDNLTGFVNEPRIVGVALSVKN